MQGINSQQIPERVENPIRVLLIEDQESDAALIRRYLNPERFNLSWRNSLADGMKLLEAGEFDIILLDLSLPDSDGLQTLSHLLHRGRQIPVIVLTGDRDETKGVDSLRIGAQDFLVKGITPPELVGRAIIFALERSKNRAENKALPNEELILHTANLDIDLQKQVISFNKSGEKQNLFLTPYEFRLFVYLFQNANSVISRDQLIAGLWPDNSNEISIRTIDRHMSSLKKKCENLPITIQTIYGIGYRLEFL